MGNNSVQTLASVFQDMGAILPLDASFQLETKPRYSPEPVTEAWINPTSLACLNQEGHYYKALYRLTSMVFSPSWFGSPLELSVFLY